MNYCFLNGKIIPEKDAKISVNDIGLLRGFGVFDYLRTENGRPVLIKEHLQRFENSARIAGLKIPVSKAKIQDIIGKLIQKNELKNGGIRMVLTGGESPDGLTFSPETPTFLILTHEMSSLPTSILKKGAKLITRENLRERPGAKTLNYLTKLSLSGELKKKQAYEVLYTHNGQVLECSTCNFFIFIGDTLVTAKEDVLKGTRRALILQLAKKRYTIEERSMRLLELPKATEAFISSTTRGIIPVTKIDNLVIGKGKVGKNTRELMRLFDDYIAKLTA